MDRVSVVLCTYNGDRFIGEQLDSIVQQSYPIYEVIIQDDCSTDTTRSILDSYQNRYSFIHCFYNDCNKGVNANFWSAFEKASGDYIAIADQDDIWLPHKIERLVSNIGDHDLIYADSIAFTNEISTKTTLESNSTFSLWRFIAWQEGVLGHDCLIRRELVNKVPSNCKHYLVYDFALALVALSGKGLSHVTEGLTYFRRHPSAYSNLFQRKGNRLWGYIECFRALSIHNRQEIAARYQAMLPLLKEVDNQEVFQYAYYLSIGSCADLLKACVLSYRNRAILKNNNDSLSNRIRSFFIPLFIYGKWPVIKCLWGVKK